MLEPVVIKDCLLKSVLLFLCLSLVPYFDYRRLLPPEPTSVEMQCELTGVDTAAFRVTEARLALQHIAMEGAWHDEMRLLLPTVLVKRHIHCRYGDAERQYTYNRLYPNVTGFSVEAVVLELTARYETPFRLWNYAETPAQTFRPYPFDEHLLLAAPVDRDEDWLVVYLFCKSLTLFLSVALVSALLWLRHAVMRLRGRSLPQ